MPIEATPLEQEVLLVATKLTDVLTVLPLLGLVTVTPANENTDAIKTEIRIRAIFFITDFSDGYGIQDGEAISATKESHGRRAEIPGMVLDR
jgi:hypothetical protein